MMTDLTDVHKNRSGGGEGEGGGSTERILLKMPPPEKFISINNIIFSFHTRLGLSPSSVAAYFPGFVCDGQWVSVAAGYMCEWLCRR